MIEKNTEERAFLTLLRALHGTDWRVTLLAGQEFVEKLDQISFTSEFECIPFSHSDDLGIANNYDLVLILNPINWTSR